jgi:hypothetical protein
MAYEIVVLTRINKPADDVWEWMADARNVLSLNMFHERVEWDEPILEAGPRVPVPHDFYGLKQRRVAHIRDYHKYLVGFGETKSKDEPGIDAFPHYQSFELLPLSDGTCVVANRLRGVYQFPGAARFGEWIFNRWTPYILEEDNNRLAVAVGALAPDDKPKIKGVLRLWRLFVLGGKVMNAKQRRKVALAQKKDRAAPADKASSEPPVAAGPNKS